MRKPPSRFEYYNDSDGEVVNFFQVLRERSEDLVRALELTPFSRAELLVSRQPATRSRFVRTRGSSPW